MATEAAQKRTAGGGFAHAHIGWAFGSLLALLIGFTVGRATAPKPTEHLPTPAATIATCVSVLDGDTIRVMWNQTEEDIRLLGIDCPETKNSRKLQEQASKLHLKKEYVLQYGEIARKTTESWLLNRDIHIVFPSDEVSRDAFGRLLAYVEQQGVDVGERLLRGGNAFLWEEPHPREETYRLLADDAKRQNKGIWRKY